MTFGRNNALFALLTIQDAKPIAGMLVSVELKATRAHPMACCRAIAVILSPMIRKAAGRAQSKPTGWTLAIVSAVLTDAFFTKPDDFEIQTFANRGFAFYQNDLEYEEIEWKFSPKVAENVMGTLFHPQQTEEVLQDGSIVIRFKAAGQLEMAWYLYQWGSSVEVLKPESLRMMVEGYQRSDFPALP